MTNLDKLIDTARKLAVFDMQQSDFSPDDDRKAMDRSYFLALDWAYIGDCGWDRAKEEIKEAAHVSSMSFAEEEVARLAYIKTVVEWGHDRVDSFEHDNDYEDY